jgi:hypothetical protein
MLLDNQPAAIALLRFEQKLHGRPGLPFESHPVDQVNDNRRADEGAADHHVDGV